MGCLLIIIIITDICILEKKVISLALVYYSTKPLFDLKKLSFLNVVLIFKINPMHIEGIAAVNIDHS